jgi:hypothetical protein
MKHNNHSQAQSHQPAKAARPTSTAGLNSASFDFTPAPEEVARRAYFTYVNQGSPDGCDVQHWLQAEAELTAERKLTRTHGFQNRN